MTTNCEWRLVSAPPEEAADLVVWHANGDWSVEHFDPSYGFGLDVTHWLDVKGPESQT